MFEVYECDAWDCGVVATFETLADAERFITEQEVSSDVWYEVWEDGFPMD